jgi:hypothetical protein
MKYFVKPIPLYQISPYGKDGSYDFPAFIAFTDEERKVVQRDFLEAKLNGFAADLRKICATFECQEGYNVQDLIQEMENVPEVSKEIWDYTEQIPGWRPIQEMGKVLSTFIETYKNLREIGQKELKPILEDLEYSRLSREEQEKQDA